MLQAASAQSCREDALDPTAAWREELMVGAALPPPTHTDTLQTSASAFPLSLSLFFHTNTTSRY